MSLSFCQSNKLRGMKAEEDGGAESGGDPDRGSGAQSPADDGPFLLPMFLLRAVCASYGNGLEWAEDGLRHLQL